MNIVTSYAQYIPSRAKHSFDRFCRSKLEAKLFLERCGIYWAVWNVWSCVVVFISV